MSERIIVSVKEGKVRGVKRCSEYSGAEFYSFYGVPYGQPPISGLRFKDPVKVKPWKDVYDATVEKPGCIQFSLFCYGQIGTEDCLFNNIHTPELPTKSTPLRPVIVYIHPGGFLHGTPNEDYFGSTSFIMHNNVVYVVVAYRLHILGFLNLGIKECSGNQGIKDIILSLQWIKDNISSFGGDSRNITLIGNSNGGAVIHTLMVSPAAKGLFHKGIIMGGQLFDPTAHFQEKNEKSAIEFAQMLGYKGNVDDTKKLLLFLKKVNPVLFVEVHRKLQKEYHKTIAPILPMGIFTITVDNGENAVMPKPPRELIPTMSKIPLIIGYADRESAMGFFRGYIRESTEKNFKTSVRQNQYGWGRNLSNDDIELIYQQVESFYLNGKPIKQASLSTMVDIQTGIIVSDVYDKLINIVAENPESPVYVYQFQFEGEMNTLKTKFVNLLDEKLAGTFHSDDISYWARAGDPLNVKTKQMVDIFTKLIATFARTGEPTFEDLQIRWKPTTAHSPCYLSINNDLQMIDGRVHGEKLQFWDNIKKQFAKE